MLSQHYKTSSPSPSYFVVLCNTLSDKAFNFKFANCTFLPSTLRGDVSNAFCPRETSVNLLSIPSELRTTLRPKDAAAHAAAGRRGRLRNRQRSRSYLKRIGQGSEIAFHNRQNLAPQEGCHNLGLAGI